MTYDTEFQIWMTLFRLDITNYRLYFYEILFTGMHNCTVTVTTCQLVHIWFYYSITTHNRFYVASLTDQQTCWTQPKALTNNVCLSLLTVRRQLLDSFIFLSPCSSITCAIDICLKILSLMASASFWLASDIIICPASYSSLIAASSFYTALLRTLFRLTPAACSFSSCCCFSCFRRSPSFCADFCWFNSCSRSNWAWYTPWAPLQYTAWDFLSTVLK